MNLNLKEATVKSFHYDNHEQLKTYLQAFMDAYNFARQLKTLKGLTPHEFICKTYENQTHTTNMRDLITRAFQHNNH